MAKVLISDAVADNCVEKLKQGGHELVFKTEKKTPKELAKIIPGYDAVIVRSATKVRKVAIDATDDLKIIVRAGVGLDNIDCDYADSKGIKVSNTPTASSAAVAELALAHMFALYRFLPQANITMRDGEWNKKQYNGHELGGKTLGLIGFGNIGKTLAQKAIAFGMKVIAYDPYVDETDLDVEIVELNEILSNSDIISLHIPHTDETHYIIDAAALDKIKDSAILINCARGGVVDEDALLKALEEDKIAGAAVDSYEEEPTDNIDLVNNPRVSVTPHIGAATKEAQARVGLEAAQIINDFFT